MTDWIAVVGAGAIGQLYGAELLLAGRDVRFVARRDARALATAGLRVRHTPVQQLAASRTHPRLDLPPERFRVSANPSDLATDSPPSWILISLKTTAFPGAFALLDPLVGPRTRLVVMCNGLGIEDLVAERYGASRVLGLLCFVAANRDADGTILHIAYGQLVAGHFLRRTEERDELVALMQGAGVECTGCASLLEARWRKLAWNLPFNGLCIAHDVTTDGIVGDPARRRQATLLCHEVVAMGNADLVARGESVTIEDAWADEQIRRTDTMGPYAPSTLLDVRRGVPTEAPNLFGEPYRRARALGLPVPTFGWLIAALEARGLLQALVPQLEG